MWLSINGAIHAMDGFLMLYSLIHSFPWAFLVKKFEIRRSSGMPQPIGKHEPGCAGRRSFSVRVPWCSMAERRS